MSHQSRATRVRGVARGPAPRPVLLAACHPSRRKPSHAIAFLASLLAVLLAALPARGVEPGTIMTAAGNGNYGYSGDGGLATEAGLQYAFGVAVGEDGTVYVADTYSHRIRAVDSATGVITTIAGNGIAGHSGDGGPANQASLAYPYSLTVDDAGNLYVADTFNHRVRYVSAQTGVIATIAGNGQEGFTGDGLAKEVALNRPTAVALDSQGGLYVADSLNNRVRRVALSSGTIATVVGTGEAGFSGDGGPAHQAALSDPFGVALDPSRTLYITDLHNQRIRTVDRQTGVIATIAGDGEEGFAGDGGPASDATMNRPSGITLDASGNVYFADSANNRVRRIDGQTGVITTVAGNGSPVGIVAANAGFYGILPSSVSSELVGDGGPAPAAVLTYPIDVAVGRDGEIFIADGFGHRVRMVT